MKKTVFYRDFSLGCLFFVISLFPAVFAWNLTKNTDAFWFLVIYFLIRISNNILNVAKELIFGVEIDLKDE